MQDLPLSLFDWHKSDDCFRLLVDTVKDYGFFTLDPAGFVTSWNPGARHLKGYEEREIVGSHFSRFYPAEDIAAGKPANELKRAVAFGRVEDEGWRVRKDGTRFRARVVITALRDPATGELRGFGKVTHDLTAQTEAGERLRHSEEQFRLLVESVHEYAIFMLDPTGCVATWNSGAEKAKGYAVEEIVGEHFELFYPAEDRASGKPARLLEEAKRKGHVREQGTRVRKNGSTFQADVLITAVHDEEGRLRGFSKVTRDVTDQIHTRDSEAARLAAEKAGKAKDDFLAVLSHELRTPLTPVLAGADYLIGNAAQVTPAELVKELCAIRRNALLEAQLIDDLLDLTRISRGKIELQCELLDLHAVLSEICVISQENISAKGLVIMQKLDAGQHWTKADPIRIRQALWNVLSNAVKFTPNGGRISVRTCNNSAGKLRVEISDTGVGIEPEQADRIFDAFEQGERTVTRRFGGLGLGLAITRSIINLHGGSISVHSHGHDKGASFLVELDAASKAAAATESETAAAATAGITAHPLRILLVEDHADTQRILSRLLSRLGHEVELASDVKDGLAHLQNATFDCLLSDIGLPDGSGLDLMSAARATQPRIRGIALSGFGMEQDLRNSTAAGFECHLTKPVDFAALRGVLAQLS